MRLINVSNYQVESFPSHETPPYAILSHTWGSEEVILKDMQRGDWETRTDKREGRDKIKGCCSLASAEGFDYVWIDTCCIDKTSSDELSESINSMYRWYHNSTICYAYLNDVDSSQDPTEANSDFAKSRWFTRGWTLQELLAPAEVIFLGSDWGEIGTKLTLQAPITAITRISGEALADQHFSKYSVAQKMSWAAGRRTTRLEDEAYCLFGLFDVNMPLIYGEGERAFFRLQEQIMKQGDDESIFAWSYPPEEQTHVQLTGLLAPSPSFFRDSSNIAMKASSANRHKQLGAANSSDIYLNPFEIVRQVVRISFPILGPLRGFEAESKEEESAARSLVSVEPATERTWEPSNGTWGHPDGTLDGPITNAAVADTDSLWTTVVQLSVNSSEPTGAMNGGLGKGDSEAVAAEPTTWQWYIYEPISIVPLMCSIEGSALGIVLAKGSFRSGKEGVMYRLHSPSLVHINDISAFSEHLSPPSNPTYVYATATYDNDVQESHIVSSEVRIAGLIKNGYDVFQEPGSEWNFESRDGKLVKMHEHHPSRTSMVVFHPRSGDLSRQPSFFLVLDFDKPQIGVLTGSTIPMLGQQVWSIAMKGQNRAEIPMGSTGRAIVLKLRETMKLRYLNLSIEPRVSKLPGAPQSPVRSGMGGFNLRLQRIWSSVKGNEEQSTLDSMLRLSPENSEKPLHLQVADAVQIMT